MTFDDRIVPFLLWGLGTVGLYTLNLSREVREWVLHRDRRGTRDALIAMCLFICALASCLSVASLLFGVAQDDPLRRALMALALGAFTGVGVVMVTVRKREDPARG